MELPLELKTAINAVSGGVPRAELVKAAGELTYKYVNETGTGKRLLTRADEAASYCVARMPATYAAARAALAACALPDARTLLDVGAGTGAVSWAALAELPSLERIVCMERESAMINVGKALSPGGIDVEWRAADAMSCDFSEKFDVVTSSFCIGEMSGTDRLRLARSMWKCADRLLVIIEPGTPVGYSNILEIRAALIGEGARVAAPCPHDRACPLPEGDWCHFACRVARSRAHKALKGGDAPYEDVKFSYIALARDDVPERAARVLRHPDIQPGRITLKMCGAGGIFEETVTKRDAQRFKRARKARWGDAIGG